MLKFRNLVHKNELANFSERSYLWTPPNCMICDENPGLCMTEMKTVILWEVTKMPTFFFGSNCYFHLWPTNEV
jgi:hypothetical protein